MTFLPRSGVGAIHLPQTGERMPTTLALNTRVSPLVGCDPCHPCVVAVRRRLGKYAVPSNVCPCPASQPTTPLSCGRRAGFQIMVTPRPINHRARSVGQSPADPQGTPLSTRKRLGLPPPRKYRAQRLLHDRRLDQIPRRCWGENNGLHKLRRCIHPPTAANSPADRWRAAVGPRHPSARRRAEHELADHRWPDAGLAAPAPRSSVETSVAAFVHWHNSRGPVPAKERESIRRPTWDAARASQWLFGIHPCWWALCSWHSGHSRVQVPMAHAR